MNIVKWPNPRAGEQGAGTTTYVYRPWTAEDVREETEGIPHPKGNTNRFSDGVKNLCVSYMINGLETRRRVF